MTPKDRGDPGIPIDIGAFIGCAAIALSLLMFVAAVLALALLIRWCG